jgi:hypothetical protein
VRALAFLLLGCATAPAAPKALMTCTRTVAPGEDLPAIVAALPAGAVLCLQPGRYETHLRLARSLTLRGTAPGVVLDAGRRSPTVEVVHGEADVVLERLTLTGGNGGSGGRGGNLHVHDARTVALREVALLDGRSDHNGGGALLARSGKISVDSCYMSGNHGKKAQAVLVDGPAEVTLSSCLIVGDGADPLLRVTGVGELHLSRTTAVTPGVALRASGDAVDAPSVTVKGCILGLTPLQVDAPGPAPSVRVSDSALAAPLEGATDGGGNHVGELGLDEQHRPRPGSPAAGRGAPPGIRSPEQK